jgi:uncharacterized protein with HEPN domain
MAPSKTPLNRLNHILEEASEIEAATRGLSFETFRDILMELVAAVHDIIASMEKQS